MKLIFFSFTLLILSGSLTKVHSWEFSLHKIYETLKNLHYEHDLSDTIHKRSISPSPLAKAASSSNSPSIVHVLSPDQWFTQFVEMWTNFTRIVKDQILAWHKSNPRIGQWWIDKAHDDIHNVSLNWFQYIDSMRSNYSHLGAVTFQDRLGKEVDKKFETVISTLKNQITERMKEGKEVLQNMANPSFQMKLSLLRKYQPQYLKKYREFSATVWRRCQSAKFQTFLDRLKASTSKFKKLKCFGIEWSASFRLILDGITKRYKSIHSLWMTTILQRGYEWFLTYGQLRWKVTFGVIRRRARRVIRGWMRQILAHVAIQLGLGLRLTPAPLQQATVAYLKRFDHFMLRLQIREQRFLAYGWRRLYLHGKIVNTFHKIIHPPHIRIRFPWLKRLRGKYLKLFPRIQVKVKKHKG